VDDPLSKMPPSLRRWADKRGLDKLLRRYGWSICEVCGRIGYRWTSQMVPGGHNLEFEWLFQGWIHPPGDGWEGAEGQFRTMWQIAEKEDQTIPEELMADFFDLFMKGVSNTIDPSLMPAKGKGRTNPFDFCVLDRTPLWKRQDVSKICPKCGEPGTGEGVLGGERRFFHGPNKSCYIGMLNPIRKRAQEVKCPKCGELGRESISKSYKYIRHAKKTCYVGKISDETPIQHSGTVREF